jgi:hypothetical protein
MVDIAKVSAPARNVRMGAATQRKRRMSKTPSRFAVSDPTPVFPLRRLHEGQEERALLERLDLVLEGRFEYAAAR